MLHKLFLYGGPGVGKSVFALQFPKPFFITTDGNYEFLKIFGAKDEDHKQCWSWKEIKKVIQELYTTNKYDKYQTIVLDLVEDSWKWCEQEWLEQNKIDHPSDMGYGKAYDVPRTKFFTELGRLLAVPKNIILLSHEQIIMHKTKKGIEWCTYAPSSKLPEKLMDSIEGRLTACLRCYTDVLVDEDGKQVKSRFLNLVPQDDEFGIIRGVNENKTPHTIELKYSVFNKILEEQQIEAAQEFLNMLEKDDDVKEFKKLKANKVEKVEETKETEEIQNVAEEKPRRRRKVEKEEKEEVVVEKLPEPEETEEKPVEEGSDKIEVTNEDKKASILAKIRARQQQDEEKSKETSKVELLKKIRDEKETEEKEVEEIIENAKEEVKEVEQPKVESRAEKLARLRKMRG